MSYTVNISLPKQLAETAKEQVKKGYYTSLSEVVRDGLRCLLIAEPHVPTFKMSKRAERKAIKSLKNHSEGKTILLKNINDLDKLI